MSSVIEKNLFRSELSQTLWNLALPVVALNLLQVVNSLLDRFFIGHLPASSMSAHGASMSFVFLLFSLAYSISVGAGAIVSRAYGAKEVSEYRSAAQQSYQVAMVVGIVIATIAQVLIPLAATVTFKPGDTEEIRQLTMFLRAYGIGIPAVCIIQALAASLRSIGDTRSPMFLSGLQILIHVLLNFVLVMPPTRYIPSLGLGLVGAGYALSISAWIAAILYTVYVRKSPLQVHFTLRPPKPEWFTRILKIAVPSGVQAALRTFSLTAFTVVLSNVPKHEVAMAAMGTGFAIESLMFAQAFGVSAAVGALVGQKLGAKVPHEAERVGWLGSIASAAIAVVVSIIVFFTVPMFAGTIVGNKPDVTAEVISIVRWLCVTEPLFCVAMVMIGAMQGAGDTQRPLWIGIFSLWVLRLPIAIVLALPAGAPLILGLTNPIGFGLGAVGAWIAMSTTQAVQGVFSAIAWKKGAWKLVKV